MVSDMTQALTVEGALYHINILLFIMFPFFYEEKQQQK
jgi:hypothetical protein